MTTPSQNELDKAIERASCRKADAIISAINATIKPYQEHLTTATAMLFIGIFQDIEQLERENNQLRADLKQTKQIVEQLKQCKT